ncbi:protein argonaute 4-like isoform X1 [Eucalyptus grandis]|uniref:protein argonaute 4-like isoform X1 n=1 Tax=Eucalyptus grandis TaxID=71139 RepID=UPI00192EC5E6|nr:protein argonaute 4-like isoform X1 [Eucalyptus grandis]
MLRSCGITISNSFTQVEGRVLPAPKLNVGNGEDFFPRNGRWSFQSKKFVEPAKIQKWAVVNFSARCDMRGLIRDLTRLAEMKGLLTEQPFDVFEESPQFRRAPPAVRVDKMFEEIQAKLPGVPLFLKRLNYPVQQKQHGSVTLLEMGYSIQLETGYVSSQHSKKLSI